MGPDQDSSGKEDRILQREKEPGDPDDRHQDQSRIKEINSYNRDSFKLQGNTNPSRSMISKKQQIIFSNPRENITLTNRSFFFL